MPPDTPWGQQAVGAACACHHLVDTPRGPRETGHKGRVRLRGQQGPLMAPRATAARSHWPSQVQRNEGKGQSQRLAGAAVMGEGW